MASSSPRIDLSSTDAIAAATFTSSRRGYDQDEVHAALRALAGEVGRARDEIARLKVELASRPTDGGQLDEATIAAALGEEAAHVLTAAHSAAVQMRSRAEDASARLLRDASEEAARVREAAELDAAHRRREASDAAVAEIEAAKTEGRQMVLEARAVRERMLADLARRKESARQQFDLVQDAHERVLRSLGAARHMVDDASNALSAALPDLHRPGVDDTQPVPVVAPLGDQADARSGGAPYDHTSDDANADGTEADDHPAAAKGSVAADAMSPGRPEPSAGFHLGEMPGRAVDLAQDAGPASSLPSRRLTLVVTDPEVEVDEPAAAEADETGLDLGEVESSVDEPEIVIGAVAADAAVDEPAIEIADAASDTTASEVAAAQDDPEVAGEVITEVATAREVAAAQDDPDAGVAGEKARPTEAAAAVVSSAVGVFGLRASSGAAPSSGVELVEIGRSAGRLDAVVSSADDLFARIRAGRPDTAALPSAQRADRERVDKAAVASHGSTAPTATTDEPRGSLLVAVQSLPQRPMPADPDAARAAIDARAAVLDPLILQASRRLKRTLADEQNEVLDRLRRGPGVPAIDALLGELAAHALRYRDAIADDLAAAAKAGAVALGGSARDARKVESALIDEITGEFVTPLRHRLHDAVAEAGGDADAASDRLRAAYREWKVQRLDAVAGHLLRVAYGRGGFAALAPGAPVCWAVDPGAPPCPDADDNVLGGAVPAGEAFPTGHRQAPAYPGCRCVLVATHR